MSIKFGWICSDTQLPMKNNQSIYLLIPQEFGGGFFEERNYLGDGVFCGRSVYEMVALWNKEKIDENTHPMYKPSVDDFPYTDKGRERFSKCYQAYKQKIKVLKNLKTTDINLLKYNFGDNVLEKIGLDIACYDEQNMALPYPIKVTQAPSIYEKAEASLFMVYKE